MIWLTILMEVRQMNRKYLYQMIFACAVAAVCTTSRLQATVPATADTGFAPHKAPEGVEWSRFMELSIKEAEALWNDQAHKGVRFAGWNWKWRLAWVKLCALNPKAGAKFCDEILDEALTDKALVVRAEAASAIGDLKEGSMDPVASRKLLAVLRDPRNRRNDVPVMAQKRAMYSLVKIGHADSIRAADEVVSRDSALRLYWNKLK